MQVAERMSRLGTETAFEVLVKARALEAQGRDVVHLEIGEPDFDTPPHVITAGKQALDEGYTHYGPSAGLPELREAIAADVARSRGIDVRMSQVVVTPGAKPIMFFVIMALAQAGDEVIYPDPGFPIYESVIRFVGAKPVPVPLREARGFGLDVDELKSLVSPRTRLIILNSPHNPTGGMLPEADLRAIADVAMQHGIPVLTDEIYSQMLYDGTFHSISAYDGMADLAIILDGFSKTYAMTGWRLGYGVMPEIAGGPRDAPDDQLQFLHRVVHAARRPGRPARAAGRRGRDDVGVPAPPRPVRRRAERHRRHKLRGARRRLLRLSEHYRTRPHVQGSGGSSAAGRRRGGPGGR